MMDWRSSAEQRGGRVLDLREGRSLDRMMERGHAMTALSLETLFP
jgi:hypothetical protein